jgi:PPOX class probable F420-dependent enzyme
VADSWSPESLLLFAEAAPAVLTTYRKDGTASTSPVWFRFHDETLEVVIAKGDVKLRHLESDPHCALLVFETRSPFRGVRVEGVAVLSTDDDGGARLEIASRYLGPDDGPKFNEQRVRPGYILRIEPTATSQWDLSAILPRSDA